MVSSVKRDMDLVRSILFEVEEAARPLSVGDLDYRGHSQEEVVYHVNLMAERGLLDATSIGSWSRPTVYVSINGLTWDGQDFLDVMRDERVFAKAKKAVKASLGTTTFDVLKAVLVKLSTEAVLAAV